MTKTINDIVLELKNHKIEHNNGVLWEMGYREGCQFGAIHGINSVLEEVETYIQNLDLGNSAEEKFYKLDAIADIGLFIKGLKEE